MRRHAIVRTLAFSALAALLLSAATCPPTPAVTIHYEQVGACTGYARDLGGVTAGGRDAYVAFQITAIDNATGVDFLFDPERLYVPGSSRQFISTTLAPAVDFGPSRAIMRTIPRGKREEGIGMAVTTVTTASAAPDVEANRTSYLLQYDTPAGGPGVVLAKNDLDRKCWPKDKCTTNCTCTATPDCTQVFKAFAPLFPFTNR